MKRVFAGTTIVWMALGLSGVAWAQARPCDTGHLPCLKALEKLQSLTSALSGYRDAMSRGDLALAKQILVGRMIPLNPQGRGNYLLAAKLCYERKEPGEAKRYLKTFLASHRPEDEPFELSMEIDAFDLLLNADDQGIAPNWSDLPVRVGARDVDSVLERMCRGAIVGGFLYTAERLMGELRRLAVPAWRVEMLRTALAERRLQQREAIGSARNLG